MKKLTLLLAIAAVVVAFFTSLFAGAVTSSSCADAAPAQLEGKSYAAGFEDKSGLYFGVTAFNQKLYTLPVAKVRYSGLDECETFFNSLSPNDGSILYYAVEKSLDALQTASLPDNLSKVALVTLTGGTDQGSLMMNPKYANDKGYLAALNERIKTEKVCGVGISAYSIGIRESNVTNVGQFRNNLSKLASCPDNVFEVENILQAKNCLCRIAGAVCSPSHFTYNIKFIIPGVASGTRIRFTFDDVTSASRSKLFIEGTLDLDGRSLKDVKFHGLNASGQSMVAVTLDGIFLTFQFKNVSRSDEGELSFDYVRVWNHSQSDFIWQMHSGFDRDKHMSVNSDIVRLSTAVILVADCSSSFTSLPDPIDMYYRGFLFPLCDASKLKYSVDGVYICEREISLRVGEKSTLTAEVFPSTALNRSITWSSSDPSVATVSEDGVVAAVGDGVCTVTATAHNGASCSCEVKSFLDLSSDGTANCYIVSAPGTYTFKATVKGSSSVPLDGTPAKAEVLWESFGTDVTPSVGDIINSVSYSGGKIVFSTPMPLNNGNAVIAVKDASGNILWSWHIWVCDGFDPVATAQVYNNNAGTMMDRNLGATSAIPGDVQALGLLYQWGRKDPFLGASSIDSNTDIASSTLSWPSSVGSTSSTGTIAYAVSHPTTFITQNTGNYDWYYTDSESTDNFPTDRMQPFPDWYYTGSESTDNTRWQTSDKDKGMYDPCPAGWRVPDGGESGVWSKAFGSSSYYENGPWNSTNRGMDFGRGNGEGSAKQLGSSSTIWYPAAGYRSNDGGALNDVGSDGDCWSCLSNGDAYGLYFGSIGYVCPSLYYFRALGQSVRCLSESK